MQEENIEQQEAVEASAKKPDNRTEKCKEGFAKGRRIYAQNRAEIMDRRLIVANTLAEYTEQLVKAVSEGYELTLHKNDGYPTHRPPSLYSCVLTLFKYPEPKIKEVSPEKQAMLEKFAGQEGAAAAEVEAREPSKRGRRPKGV